MKRIGILAVVMAAAFLFVGVASAEMYVEGYLGGSQASNMGQAFTIHDIVNSGVNNVTQNNHLQFSGKTDTAVLGGLKIGTWFVPEGFAGWSGYPSWAKYFGFYTDFSYQTLMMRNQRVSGTSFISGANANGNFVPGGSFVNLNAGNITSEGSIATWAFMFAARYGFFPDSEVPFGRLQPYVAVGPAVMFSSMKPKINTFFVGGVVNGFNASNFSPGNQGSTNIALAADAGVRYMALKNVSIDISFKYRYAQPTYTFGGRDANNLNGFQGPATMKLNPVYDLYSFQAGVAYHF